MEQIELGKNQLTRGMYESSPRLKVILDWLLVLDVVVYTHTSTCRMHRLLDISLSRVMRTYESCSLAKEHSFIEHYPELQ